MRINQSFKTKSGKEVRAQGYIAYTRRGGDMPNAVGFLSQEKRFDSGEITGQVSHYVGESVPFIFIPRLARKTLAYLPHQFGSKQCRHAPDLLPDQEITVLQDSWGVLQFPSFMVGFKESGKGKAFANLQVMVLDQGVDHIDHLERFLSEEFQQEFAE